MALVAFPISRKIRQRQSNHGHPQNDPAQCASTCVLGDICLTIRASLGTQGMKRLTGDQLQRRAWDLSSLVLDIVTACSLIYEKGKRVHSLSVLKEITNTLICHNSPMVALLFSNVAVEASMAYAQIHIDDKADWLLWASELQHQIQTSLSTEEAIMPTPSLNSFGGLAVMDSKGTRHVAVLLHGKAFLTTWYLRRPC